MVSSAEVHRSYLDAVNRHDLGDIRSHLAPEFRHAFGLHQHDALEWVTELGDLFSAFPDLRLDVRHHHSTADVSVLELSMRGTHLGRFGPLTPTNRPIDVWLVDIVEVTDSYVVAERQLFNEAEVFQQLGVLS